MSSVKNEQNKVINQMKEIQGLAKQLNDSKGYKFQITDLEDSELLSFDGSFKRSLLSSVQAYNPEAYFSIFDRHIVELMLCAMIAKQQMDLPFRGPEASEGFGAEFDFRAGWLGQGDGWFSAFPTTAGAIQNWIHSGSTQLGGTAAAPLRIRRNAVFCILGYALITPDIPRVQDVVEYIDTAQLPVVNGKSTWAQTMNGQNYRFRELDKARILNLGKTFRTEIFNERTVSTVAEYAQPIGALFTTVNNLRQRDVGALTASNLATLEIIDINA